MNVTQLSTAIEIYMKHAKAHSFISTEMEAIRAMEFLKRYGYLEIRLGCCGWPHTKLRVDRDGNFYVDLNMPRVHLLRDRATKAAKKVTDEWKKAGLPCLDTI